MPGKGTTNRRNIMKSSTKDNTEGKMHQVRGKFKETVGKIVGNRDLEADGNIENLGGKVQEKLGQVEKVVGK
jgi:uncharacterized protein YjbJ (UPF0337 family)